MGQLDKTKNPWEVNLTSSNADQTTTLYTSGTLLDRDIKISIGKMATQTPTTSFANTGLGTYFNTGTSTDYNVSITPRYSNSAGYVAAHTNTNNGGIGYYKIKTANPAFDGGGLVKNTASGGGLSGGGLTAGAGEVSVTNGTVTPSVGGTGVNSTAQTSYGMTTTKPSGTDGTNYITFDPDASVTTNGTAKGRGSVNRAAVTRAAFSQKVTRNAVLYNGAVTG